MPRGRDSARDPKRQVIRSYVHPSVAAAALSQAALRQHLTGQASADPVGDMGRVDPARQSSELFVARERNLNEIKDIMRSPGLGSDGEGESSASARVARRVDRPPSQYPMTKQEWQIRTEGKSIPMGVPSSLDPFPFGAKMASGETEQATKLKRGRGGDAPGDIAAAEGSEKVIGVTRKSDQDK